MTKPKVVIIGGGFAGVEAARRLGDRAEVTLVSRENFLLFTPMLAEVASGDVEPRHITSPLRQLCPQARVVIGEVTAVDVARRTAEVMPDVGVRSISLGGDALVLAAGSVPAGFGVPGVPENTVEFKSILDALRLRRRVVALLEAAAEERDARLTTIAIVGAGYAGAELAAGLADFLADAVPKFYPTAPRPHLVLIDAVERVTPNLPAGLSRAAAQALERRGVELILGRKVTEVGRAHVALDDGTRVETGTTIWVAGVRPGPLAEGLGLETDHSGRIVVDTMLRTGPGVFALGDIAAVPDGHGGVCPPTAQHAVRQGRYLGKHLIAILGGSSVKPFRYRTVGQLVSLGHRNAVGTVMTIKVSGFVAWFLWRSYYLMRLPTLLRKARVAIDWTLDLIFPPDIAGLPAADVGPLPGRDQGAV